LIRSRLLLLRGTSLDVPRCAGGSVLFPLPARRIARCMALRAAIPKKTTLEERS